MTHLEAIALWRKFKVDHPDMDDHSAGVLLLNVELAEREACARIAIDYAIAAAGVVGQEHAAQRVAALIRGRSGEEEANAQG